MGEDKLEEKEEKGEENHGERLCTRLNERKIDAALHLKARKA